MSNWNVNNFLNLDLNYTYTSTYDGAEQDNVGNASTQNNAQMVKSS